MKFASMMGNDETITFVPAALVEAYVARGYQVFDEATDVAWLDRGGPVLANAQQVEIMLDGTIIRIPVRDIVFYDEALISACPGPFDPGYRLEGWQTTLVLTPTQRVELLAAWGKGIENWRRAAAIEAKHFATAIQGIALHQMTPAETVH